ncbi:hypothetical protein F4776DRAFT_658285 [Hypoxylon sp. NC0597]|nr:hypothetical protein F4776DRAFT_658285 [Hypoxylon sp. NC0597]
MLVRELRRLILFLIPLLLLFYGFFQCLNSSSIIHSYQIGDWIERTIYTSNSPLEQNNRESVADQLDSQSRHSSSSDNGLLKAPTSYDDGNNDNTASELSTFEPIETHTVLFSVTTPDRKYFKLKFGDQLGINPNIIPHPILENTWTIVAQHHDPVNMAPPRFVEITCDAVFDANNSELCCVFPPIALSIASTGPGKCKGDLEYISLNVGPHDARVFYGPRGPFTVYGSNSQETCFGQWLQDFRALINWGTSDDPTEAGAQEPEQGTFFQLGTELHRPEPYSPMEKNWFIFWDYDGQMYAHYDIAPRRVFAMLGLDGSAGPDLAPLAISAGDERCMEKYMPRLVSEHESIHQATNSLSITMCQRSDPSCSPSHTNTFVFTVFQHKTFRGFHSVYEPYVMVFRQTSPFQVYGISRKPLWIYGRDARSRMFYVTSVSWKARGQRYHGYLDDVLFLGFGIEDRDTAGIDVLASDLLAGLSLCSEM